MVNSLNVYVRITQAFVGAGLVPARWADDHEGRPCDFSCPNINTHATEECFKVG